MFWANIRIIMQIMALRQKEHDKKIEEERERIIKDADKKVKEEEEKRIFKEKKLEEVERKYKEQQETLQSFYHWLVFSRFSPASLRITRM